MQKDDNGNERWEWCENYNIPVNDPTFALRIAQASTSRCSPLDELS